MRERTGTLIWVTRCPLAKPTKAEVISAAREPTLMCPCGKLWALEI